jgi:5-methylthioadenosine/S-adenosylhomocysteine deaminase
MTNSSPDNVDLILHARWIIPVEPAHTVLEHQSIAIRDGKIAAIANTDEISANFRADTVNELTNHALIPGLINTHTHAAMSLMRGLSDDLPLMTWLNDHIWPAEGKWVCKDFVRQGTEHAVAEMIRSGTTCFNDMYFFPDAAGAVASAAGIRACIGLIVIDFPSAWATNWQEYIDKGLAVNDQFRNDELITRAFAPHAPYSVSNEPLQKILTYSDELDIPIHIHLHETQDEIDQGMANHGSRPLHRLAELGLLTPSLMAVHMTHLQDNEIEHFSKTGAHIVHCPQSNMKLASGFCPVQRLQDAGVNVALGTDGAASNNDLDMLAEMQSAAMLGKAVANDAAAVSAETALEMATINGAKALGIDDITGSLAIGKAADITAIDLSQLETRPLYNPVSQIVYAADRQQVTHVWCNGKALLKDRELQTLDMNKLLNNADSWQEKLKEHHE